jgi:thioredoxin reductase (NADPH)
MTLIETRGHQLFPVLDAGQIEMAKRFASGPARNFAPGEVVFDVGERYAPVWLVLKGSIDVVRRDGLNNETAITSHGPGQFSGEVSQLAGATTLASGRAGPEGCTALPFDAAHVRALIVGSAEVGEIMMRAFILRRLGLLEEGGVGSVLVGKPGSPAISPQTLLRHASGERKARFMQRVSSELLHRVFPPRLYFAPPLAVSHVIEHRKGDPSPRDCQQR